MSCLCSDNEFETELGKVLRREKDSSTFDKWNLRTAVPAEGGFTALHAPRPPGDGCDPQSHICGEYNEFFGNLASFMNKIYFQSMSTPLNKTSGRNSRGRFRASCKRSYFCVDFPGPRVQLSPAFYLEGGAAVIVIKSSSLFQGTLRCALLFPVHTNPPCNPERNWALSEEQRREEFPPKKNLQPCLPSLNPVPRSLWSIVKTQPPLFSAARLLNQRALHEKKRLVFKCCAVKGGCFQLGTGVCSDSRVPLLFFQDEALLEPGSVSIHCKEEHTGGVRRDVRPPSSSNLPQVRSRRK